jgi:replicative DNA helicase
MTSAPLPDGEGAAALAERALLGALLWDPTRTRDVADWLTPEDFYRPGHQAIYRTITQLRTRIGGGDPRTVLDARTVLDSLATGEFHDLRVVRDGSGPIGAVGLHALMEMTPAAAPEHRIEHVHYARLVLEASIRRQVLQAGARIDQWAGRLAQDRAATDLATAGLHRTIAALAERLATLSARATAATGAEGAQPGAAPHNSVATIAAPPRPPGAAAQEQALLGACLSSGSVRREALHRLVAGDFTSPGAAATWSAIEDLAARGGPVDFVLVAAELERTVPLRGPGLPPDQLMRLARLHVGPSGYRALQAVTRSALVRIAAHSSALLAELGADPTRDSHALIAAARAAIAAANAATDRVVGTAAPPADEPAGWAAAAAAAARAIAAPPSAAPSPAPPATRRGTPASAPLVPVAHRPSPTGRAPSRHTR